MSNSQLLADSQMTNQQPSRPPQPNFTIKVIMLFNLLVSFAEMIAGYAPNSLKTVKVRHCLLFVSGWGEW